MHAVVAMCSGIALGLSPGGKLLEIVRQYQQHGFDILSRSRLRQLAHLV